MQKSHCGSLLSAGPAAASKPESPAGAHLLVQADVSRSEEVSRLVEETLAAFGRLDVLVNNAGIFEATPFDTPDYTDWQTGWKRTLDTNLMSAVNATFCVLPQMKAQGSGKVINIASRSAFRAETDAPAYAVSKAGIASHLQEQLSAPLHSGRYASKLEYFSMGLATNRDGPLNPSV